MSTGSGNRSASSYRLLGVRTANREIRNIRLLAQRVSARAYNICRNLNSTYCPASGGSDPVVLARMNASRAAAF